MSITKLDDGRYLLDFYPLGRKGPRIQRKRKTRKAAKALQLEIELEYKARDLKGKIETTRLSDLVQLWYKLHGSVLKDAKHRLSRTLAVCEALGNPLASEFESQHFSDYRIARLKQVSIATVNHETRYMRAVFNELIRLGYYKGANPIAGLRTFKEKKLQLTFLNEGQLSRLLSECEKSRNSHLAPVVRLAVQTGARWSEANNLLAQNLFPDRVVFIDTKNGDNRSVPISEELYKYLKAKAYPVTSGRLFDSCNGAFRKAVKRAGLKLPKGQSTHILRHTFASIQLMSGVDIVTLQRALGHGDIRITMRYAHLAPDHLRQIVKFAPKVF